MKNEMKLEFTTFEDVVEALYGLGKASVSGVELGTVTITVTHADYERKADGTVKLRTREPNEYRDAANKMREFKKEQRLQDERIEKCLGEQPEQPQHLDETDMDAVRSKALDAVIRGIKEGDTADSKWWLERMIA